MEGEREKLGAQVEITKIQRIIIDPKANEHDDVFSVKSDA